MLGSSLVISANRRAGPALVTAAVSNRPDMHGLSGYEALAATAGLDPDVVILTESGVPMTTAADVITRADIEAAVSETAQGLGCTSVDVLLTCAELAEEPYGVVLTDSQVAAGLAYIHTNIDSAALSGAAMDVDSEVLRLTRKTGTGVAGKDDPGDDEP